MGSGDTDAVDANGSIYVNGGTIDITANSAFDYDVSGELNGGTVTVNGSQITEMTNSMAQIDAFCKGSIPVEKALSDAQAQVEIQIG